ncbi:MAG: MBL fold metallo-hydrolase [Spirochaetaceae bacterium]|jgi:glyoxylase-like metal-dependent hydrolase (beta-lactamase superfamily II)|nr:MBL fold metallo-hydrolase [Spirochaetaceae bacterium]
MKVFCRYCPQGFSNCYILGTEFDTDSGAAEIREAILIDPGTMDEAILDFIEKNSYQVRGVFITHDHRNHVRGLRTLERIYHTEVYAVNHSIREQRTLMVRDGDILQVGPFRLEVISVPGHSADSAIFKIDRLLFTGDALSAGLLGTTSSFYGAAVQMAALRGKILSLPGDYVVLPGHGPPSTLEAERRFNLGIQLFEQNKKPKSAFTFEFLEGSG